LPSIPGAGSAEAAHRIRLTASGRKEGDRRQILSAPSEGSRTDTGNTLVIPGSCTLASAPSELRSGRKPNGASVDSLHQLVPRAAESLTEARSNRNGRLRVACFHPLEVGPVDLGQLAEMLLREARFCPQAGEIPAKDIRRRHPSSLTIPTSERRRIYAAFCLRIPQGPASLEWPFQNLNG